METGKWKLKFLILACFFMIYIMVSSFLVFGMYFGFLPKPGKDVETTTKSYEISTDIVMATEATISELYIGEKEERLQVYDIQVSEDGNSLIIYKVDSDPVIFKKGD